MESIKDNSLNDRSYNLISDSEKREAEIKQRLIHQSDILSDKHEQDQNIENPFLADQQNNKRQSITRISPEKISQNRARQKSQASNTSPHSNQRGSISIQEHNQEYYQLQLRQKKINQNEDLSFLNQRQSDLSLIEPYSAQIGDTEADIKNGKPKLLTEVNSRERHMTPFLYLPKEASTSQNKSNSQVHPKEIQLNKLRSQDSNDEQKLNDGGKKGQHQPMEIASYMIKESINDPKNLSQINFNKRDKPSQRVGGSYPDNSGGTIQSMSNKSMEFNNKSPYNQVFTAGQKHLQSQNNKGLVSQGTKSNSNHSKNVNPMSSPNHKDHRFVVDQDEDVKFESAIDSLLNQNRFLDKRKFFEKQKKLEQLRKPYQQKVFYKHSLRQEHKFPFKPLKETQPKSKSINQPGDSSNKDGIKCKSDSFMIKGVDQGDHGKTYEKDRVNSLPESVQYNMRAATNFHNRKQQMNRNRGDPTSVQSSKNTNDKDEDQISLPQLVNSKHGSSQSIHGPISNKRVMPLPQHVSNSRERLITKDNSNITSINNSKVNLSSVKYQNQKHSLVRNQAATNTKSSAERQMLEYRNIRNKTTDGFDERGNIKLQDDRQFQMMKDEFKRSSHLQPANIQIQDNKEQYNMSNITTVKKDQVSLNLKRERSSDSSLRRRGNKQLNTLRPKADKPVSKDKSYNMYQKQQNPLRLKSKQSLTLVNVNYDIQNSSRNNQSNFDITEGSKENLKKINYYSNQSIQQDTGSRRKQMLKSDGSSSLEDNIVPHDIDTKGAHTDKDIQNPMTIIDKTALTSLSHPDSQRDVEKTPNKQAIIKEPLRKQDQKESFSNTMTNDKTAGEKSRNRSIINEVVKRNNQNFVQKKNQEDSGNQQKILSSLIIEDMTNSNDQSDGHKEENVQWDTSQVVSFNNTQSDVQNGLNGDTFNNGENNGPTTEPAKNGPMLEKGKQRTSPLHNKSSIEMIMKQPKSEANRNNYGQADNAFDSRVQSRHLKMMQESRKNTNRSQGEGSHYYMQQQRQIAGAVPMMKTHTQKPIKKNRNTVKLDPMSTPSSVKISQFIQATNSLHTTVQNNQQLHSNVSQATDSGDTSQDGLRQSGLTRDEMEQERLSIKNDSQATNGDLTQAKILELDFNLRSTGNSSTLKQSNKYVHAIYGRPPQDKGFVPRRGGKDAITHRMEFEPIQPLKVQKGKDKTPTKQRGAQNFSQQVQTVIHHSKAPAPKQTKTYTNPTSFSNLQEKHGLQPIPDSAIHHREQYYQQMKQQSMVQRQKQLDSITNIQNSGGVISQTHVKIKNDQQDNMVQSNEFTMHTRNHSKTKNDMISSGKYKMNGKSHSPHKRRASTDQNYNKGIQLQIQHPHMYQVTDDIYAASYNTQINDLVYDPQSKQKPLNPLDMQPVNPWKGKGASQRVYNHYAKPLHKNTKREYKRPNEMVQKIVNQLEEKKNSVHLQNQQVYLKKNVWKNNDGNSSNISKFQEDKFNKAVYQQTPSANQGRFGYDHLITPKNVYMNNTTVKKGSPRKLFQSNSRGSLKTQEKSNDNTVENKKKLKLEDFQVLKTLGRGSFGIVKLVRDKITNNFYALKCLQKQAIKSKKQIQHIENEKSIVQKWNTDDFCCGIHETLQDQNNLYMVMEYLSGGELIRHIRKSIYLSEENTRFYLAEIVLAVESMHMQGIIYRDLKPQNILIDNNGHVKVIDFGFAKRIKNIKTDRSYTNCGTPGYCAPEVMLADVGHNYKADIWSIGILICEMIGGFIPFQNKNDAQNPKLIMEKCRSGTLNLPKNMGGNARELVKLLLQDDPMARLDIEEIKKHAFFKNVNWPSIKQRKIRPPFVPDMSFLMQYNNTELLEDDSPSHNAPITWDERRRKNRTTIKKRDMDKSADKGDKLERIPEAPNEFNLNLDSLDSPTVPKQQKTQMKIEHNESLVESDDQESEPEQNKFDKSWPRNNSRQRQVEREPSQMQTQESKSIGMSYNGSIKYSATGGTGGPVGSLSFKKHSPSKILGDYHMNMVNRAFKDF